MKDMFHYSPNVAHEKHNLYIHTQNTTKFGKKSLRAFGANIWNIWPEYIKSTTSLLIVISNLNNSLERGQDQINCKCSICK